MKTGVIILIHGSRGERAAKEVPQVLGRVVGGLKLLLTPETEITWASMQFGHPDLHESAASMVTNGIKTVVVMPYFLFPGVHVMEDIPRMVSELAARYPQTQFITTKNLGLDESFIEILAKRLVDAAPDLMPLPSAISLSPEDIERCSMNIVEALLPTLTLSPEEKSVAKRIVHASGDADIARLVRFSPDAVDAGCRAVATGTTFITDVRMAAAGISPVSTRKFGCAVVCALEDNHGASSEKAVTRAAAAIYNLGPKLNNSVVVIGNAPTALLALIDMIERGEAKPALVIGMPVGFVQAAESKAKLMTIKVPYITITGTRGGSPVAAATVNGLLKVAANRAV